MTSVADLTTSRNNRQNTGMTREHIESGRHSDDTDRLLDQDELATMLGVPTGTLEQWRARKRGPAFLRIGRHIRYDLAEVREWLDSRRNLPRGA
jgi:excisionase family DNA binding protein